jgi:hypothetical protein
VSLSVAAFLAVSIRPWKWHGRGHRFDPDQIHQINSVNSPTFFLYFSSQYRVTLRRQTAFLHFILLSVGAALAANGATRNFAIFGLDKSEWADVTFSSLFKQYAHKRFTAADGLN